MPWTKTTKPAAWSFVASSIAVPLLAWAADRRIEDDWATSTFWIIFIAIQALWVVGFLASSAPRLAKWVDGTVVGRLEVLSGVCCSLIAGNFAYYLGYYYLALAHILCFFSAFGGGFLGERYLTPLLNRVMPTPGPPNG